MQNQDLVPVPASNDANNESLQAVPMNVLSPKELNALRADELMDSILSIFTSEEGQANGWNYQSDAEDKENYKLILKASKLSLPSETNEIHHFVTRRVKKALKG